MAGRGAPPKAQHQRARDTARRIDARAIQVPDRPYDGQVPELPARDWTQATLEWWAAWTRSPQAHLFTATDWQFLIETAFIADAFYTGNMIVASELRLRMAKFGATPEDRARLRLQFVPPDESEAPKLASVKPIKKANFNLDEE